MTVDLTSDLVRAYDSVMEELAVRPDDMALRHRAVLTLARAGATEHAEREYARLGLDGVSDNEDVIALGGRLLKDRAFTQSDGDRRRYAGLSAAKYAQALAVGYSSYAAINAASMTLIAGDHDKARDYARRVLRLADGGNTSLRGEDAFYREATAAEAHLLLGNIREAEVGLAGAIARDPRNYVVHAGTLRQFEMICTVLGLDSAWLDAYRPPVALFYSGHMFKDDADRETISDIKGRIGTALDSLGAGFCYGALAAGSDILLAEAVLVRNCELHVVLPMREEDFLAVSVRPFGEGWLARYHACRDKAASFRLATYEKYMGEDGTFAFGAEYAMGLALRQAAMLRTRAAHIVLWDAVETQGAAGTSTDVKRWQATGRRQVVVPFPATLRLKPAGAPTRSIAGKRTLKAMLFADVAGFSKLNEESVEAFFTQVMTPLAAHLRTLPQQPLTAATWGDGIYLVFDEAEHAAAAATELLSGFARIDLAAVGLPGHLALRIGAHYGPVTKITDPFTRAVNYVGTHTVIAARIEPVALPGTAYVSEPFAAVLALRAADHFKSDYVGQTDLPKKFGRLRLFSLSAAQR